MGSPKTGVFALDGLIIYLEYCGAGEGSAPSFLYLLFWMRKSRLEVKRRAWGCVLEVFSLRVWLTPPAPQQLCRPRWLRSEETAAAHVDPDDVSLLVVSDSSTPAETLVPVAADPHIKVCGRRENVREAKDRIMSVLDTKVNNASVVVVVGLYLCVFFSPLFILCPSCSAAQ